MASVGLWTRPTERMFVPPRRAARLMNRVSDAPHIRSTAWRVSPAAASAKSRSVRFSKAARISAGVIAENRARLILTLGFTARTSS